jgi:hypothetical protein
VNGFNRDFHLRCPRADSTLQSSPFGLPPRGLKHARGLVSGQYRSLWQENRSELETATRRNRHHAYLTGPYLLVAWFRCTHRLPLPRSQRARSSEKGAPLRFQGKSRLGFYPLPLSEAQRIRRFLCFPDAPSSAIDPYAGDGVAFEVTLDGQNWLFGAAWGRLGEKPNSNFSRRGGLVYTSSRLGTQNGNTGQSMEIVFLCMLQHEMQGTLVSIMIERRIGRVTGRRRAERAKTTLSEAVSALCRLRPLPPRLSRAEPGR